jgi:hypothetical protein
MTQERGMVRKIREEQERSVRVNQIHLKGKEDGLARRREQLSMREAAIKRQERAQNPGRNSQEQEGCSETIFRA